MTFRPCSRQTEVKELLARGHWPHACPAELRAHLAECRPCRELLLVTRAFQQSRSTTAALAQLPAPGAIWWRAQLRRRNAAVERVAKPILGAYAFALSVMVVVAVVLAVSQARHGFHWLDWFAQQGSSALHLESFSPSTWFTSGWSLSLLIPIFATVVLVGAVVVYLSAEKQ